MKEIQRVKPLDFLRSKILRGGLKMKNALRVIRPSPDGTTIKLVVLLAGIVVLVLRSIVLEGAEEPLTKY